MGTRRRSNRRAVGRDSRQWPARRGPNTRHQPSLSRAGRSWWRRSEPRSREAGRAARLLSDRGELWTKATPTERAEIVAGPQTSNGWGASASTILSLGLRAERSRRRRRASTSTEPCGLATVERRPRRRPSRGHPLPASGTRSRADHRARRPRSKQQRPRRLTGSSVTLPPVARDAAAGLAADRHPRRRGCEPVPGMGMWDHRRRARTGVQRLVRVSARLIGSRRGATAGCARGVSHGLA